MLNQIPFPTVEIRRPPPQAHSGGTKPILRYSPFFAASLFSHTYKSLFPPTRPHRFSSSSFSCTYKSLGGQPLSFHIHTKPPGCHPPTLLEFSNARARKYIKRCVFRLLRTLRRGGKSYLPWNQHDGEQRIRFLQREYRASRVHGFARTSLHKNSSAERQENNHAWLHLQVGRNVERAMGIPI
jgi:hypothetical protein